MLKNLSLHLVLFATTVAMLCFASLQTSAQSAGFNSSYAVFSINAGGDAYYCMFSNTSCGVNPNLDAANLGTFATDANTLVLKGAEHNVYKCGGADITATTLNYRIYKTGSTPGSFIATGIGFLSGTNNGCGGQDQQWKDLTKNINVLAGVTPGNYTIEIYSEAATTVGTQFLSNSSANYKATFTVTCPSATTLYVDQSVAVSGNGVSWATAFKSLDEALFTAWNCPAVNTINVAQGTYIPTLKPYTTLGANIVTAEPRDVTFHLRNGVAMYGGFPTGGGVRNITANPTILSGDFNGDDVITGTGSTLSITGNSENAFHVVISISDNSTTRLDGFTITGGNANLFGSISVESSALFQNLGGGMYNLSSNPTIENCIFRGNNGSGNGSGLYNRNASSPIITGCTFSQNINTNSGGAGMANVVDCNPVITNCTFSGNKATNSGGVFNSNNSSPSVNNCTFTGNYADTGAGIRTTVSGSPNITNCIFSNNTAITGAGMVNSSLVTPIINNCIFSGNSANSGGGIYNSSGATPSITNSTFIGNTGIAGGGIFNQNATTAPVITNCTFSGMIVSNSGGAIYNLNGAAPVLTNCTIYGNHATFNGGGMTNDNSAAPVITNCILWNNSSGGDAGIHNVSSTPVVTYSIIQGSVLHPGVGNLLMDPLFSNPSDPDGADNIHRTADDGLRLQTGSPAINSSDPATVAPATDITGAPRLGVFDMGAYEGGVFVCPSAPTLFVDASISTSGIGTSWATAFKTLDEALSVAHCCSAVDTIKVAAGTYKPTKKPYNNDCTEMTTADAREVTFHLPDGIVIWGGYPAGGGMRNIPANPTTLSGDFNGDDVVTGSGTTLSITGNAENAYHVVLASAPSSGGIGVTIDGFSVTGGNANAAGNIAVNGNNILRNRGSGIYTNYGTNTITNHTITGNNATNGGGILTVYGTNTITNNTITDNKANSYGGGVYTVFGTNTIANNTITGNYGANGGGISTYFSTNTLITNNTITGNGAYGGGGIYTESGINTITNNTITGNNASFAGGGIYADTGTDTITNNTITGNNATNNGGGIYFRFSTGTLTNNTITGNNATDGGGISTISGNNTITNNTLTGNTANNNGGGISTNSGTNTLTNNIFWNNKKGIDATVQSADYYRASGINTFTNNLLQLLSSNYTTTGSGNYDLGIAASGNIFAQDPLFIDAADIDGADNIHRTADDGLALQSSSPAINTGTSSGAPATDILGTARPQGAGIDIGAYEFNGCTPPIADITNHTGTTILTCITTSISVTATGGSSYAWSGGATPSTAANSFNTAGTYTVTVTGSGGCTATVSITITEEASTSNTTTITACDSYTWSVNSTVYTASGTYTSVTGCHTEILALTIVASTTNTTTITACDSYTWSVNSTVYTASGTYTSVTGCHTEILALTIVASTTNTTTITACDSYTWSVNSTTYNASGTYTSVTGCHTETLILTIVASTSNTTTITACDSYTWSVNSAVYTASGTYTSVTGCHTEILALTIVASTTNTTTITACDSYTWSVNSAVYTASGTYTSVTGCHTEILILTIVASTSNTTTITACDSYTWSVNSTTYNASGTYTSVTGCHTEILALTIVASTTNTTTITSCDSYTWSVNSAVYTASGTYTSVTGCHTEILALTIVASTTNTTTITSCDSYTWSVNSAVYTASGTYTSVTGCHTEILALTIVASTTNTTTITSCDSYTWSVNSAVYNASGTYTYVTGCHTEILILTIVASTSNTTTITACDSYTWSVNSTTYNASGTYTSVTGCHTEILILTIVASTSNTTTLTACDSYVWDVNGTTYTASGTYTSVTGCHTEILILTIVASTSNTTTITACESYVWDVNGTTYTASGTYTSVTGCHTEILILTIVASTSNTTTITACDSYVWDVNGTTYTASDTYTYITGCHTEILILTIVSSTSNTTTITACDSYFWSVNGMTYNASGTFTFVNGCATEMLSLTIVGSTSNSTTISVCGSYLWDVNGETYNSSGTYTSVTGCHTEILLLTIIPNTSNTTTITACNSYLWDVNGTTYTASGVYTSVSGCHSQILNLTIITSTSTTTTISTCSSYFWSVNGATYTETGVYTSVTGCHTQILNLTITGLCPDCLGEPGGAAQPGTACDDGDPDTTDDVFGNDCICAGTPPNSLCNIGATLNGNQSVCAGGVLGLVATGGNQYQWSGPNGFNQPNGGAISRSPANMNMSGTYTVTITNNTCVDVLSIIVTVYPIPSATLSGTSSICSGGTITLNAPVGAVSYQWSGPGGFSTNTGSLNTLTRTNVNTTMAGLYKVTVTNAGGCTASASRNVSVGAPATANVTGATSVCGNANVVLTATTAGVAYSWTGPGGFTATTAAISTPALAGQYKVTVTSAAGCISTATKTITVTATPNANIIGNANICTGGTIYLLASGGNSYSWSGPSGYTKTGSTLSRSGATVAMSGTYTVTVIGSGGCTATASILVTVAPCGSKTTGDEMVTESLTAYPNPTDGETTIAFTAHTAEQITLSVYAVDGREVAILFNELTKADTTYEFALDMNHLPSGTYYAMLRHANGATEQVRVMVVR